MLKSKHIVAGLKGLVLFVLCCIIHLTASAQQQIVFNGAYIVMDNSPTLVIDNPSPTAVSSPGSGWVISENEFNQVQWNVGNNTGKYIVPFGYSTTNYIPVTINITTAGDINGALNFSTYHGPTWDNVTYMPTGVTNMHGNTLVDNSAKAVDRFWIIDATSYTTKPVTNITFTYISNEITAAGNTIKPANLFAQRFNPAGSTWADWYGAWGTDNNVLKTVSTGNVSSANLLRSWVLVDNSSPMGITPVTSEPTPAKICSLSDTSLTVVDTGIGMNFQWEVNTGSGFTPVTNSATYAGATTPTLHISGATASMNSYTYYCAIGNGMAASDTVKLTVNAAPLVTATSSPSEVCKGGSITLSAAGATTYSWLPSAAVVCNTCSATTSSPSTSVTYSVTGTDSVGCIGNSTASVKVDTLPIPKISPAQSMCSGNSVLLTVSGGASYNWSPSASLSSGTISDPVAFPATTTTYTVDVFNGVCSVKDSTVVNVSTSPTGVSASGSTLITIGTSTTISGTAPAGDSYVWSPSSSLSCDNCLDPVASPTASTTYSLIVSDSIGCKTTDTVTVFVNENCGDVFIAGAFSPDGDGHNDVLYVRGNCIKTVEFVVFDRWGNKVFESNDVANGWDGKYNGQAMNVGVYGYYVQAILYDGTKVEKKGNVGLVR
jgi:gliding motility-associated-like protein